MKATDYCKNVFDGTHDTPKPAVKGYKLLTSKNILNGCLDKEDAYYISVEDYDAVNQRSRVKQWDVLFSMIGTVGNVCLVTDEKIDFAIKNMGDFSCEDEERAKWLYYYLQGPYAKKLMENYLNGAVQKFLPLGWLRDLDIPEYDAEKKSIVGFLWDIDSKIANNNAICSNLEAMAKLLYDYWFAQFDFPDENGKPYKSSGGKMVWNEGLKREIPEGWSVGTIKDLGDVIGGATPSTEESSYYADSGIPWATPKDLSAYDGLFFFHGERDISEQGLKSCSAVLMPKGAVMMTSRAPIGYLAIAANEVCTNQGFKSVVPHDIYGTFFTYFTLQVMMPYIKRYGVGSTFAEVSKQDVEGITVVLPTEKILVEYNKIVEDAFERICLLEQETMQLKSIRDFLLPMLMNGQVKVG